MSHQQPLKATNINVGDFFMALTPTMPEESQVRCPRWGWGWGDAGVLASDILTY